LEAAEAAHPGSIAKIAGWIRRQEEAPTEVWTEIGTQAMNEAEKWVEKVEAKEKVNPGYMARVAAQMPKLKDLYAEARVTWPEGAEEEITSQAVRDPHPLSADGKHAQRMIEREKVLKKAMTFKPVETYMHEESRKIYYWRKARKILYESFKYCVSPYTIFEAFLTTILWLSVTSLANPIMWPLAILGMIVTGAPLMWTWWVRVKCGVSWFFIIQGLIIVTISVFIWFIGKLVSFQISRVFKKVGSSSRQELRREAREASRQSFRDEGRRDRKEPRKGWTLGEKISAAMGGAGLLGVIGFLLIPFLGFKESGKYASAANALVTSAKNAGEFFKHLPEFVYGFFDTGSEAIQTVYRVDKAGHVGSICIGSKSRIPYNAETDRLAFYNAESSRWCVASVQSKEPEVYIVCSTNMLDTLNNRPNPVEKAIAEAKASPPVPICKMVWDDQKETYVPCVSGGSESNFLSADKMPTHIGSFVGVPVVDDLVSHAASLGDQMETNRRVREAAILQTYKRTYDNYALVEANILRVSPLSPFVDELGNLLIYSWAEFETELIAHQLPEDREKIIQKMGNYLVKKHKYLADGEAMLARKNLTAMPKPAWNQTLSRAQVEILEQRRKETDTPTLDEVLKEKKITQDAIKSETRVAPPDIHALMGFVSGGDIKEQEGKLMDVVQRVVTLGELHAKDNVTEAEEKLLPFYDLKHIREAAARVAAEEVFPGEQIQFEPEDKGKEKELSPLVIQKVKAIQVPDSSGDAYDAFHITPDIMMENARNPYGLKMPRYVEQHYSKEVEHGYFSCTCHPERVWRPSTNTHRRYEESWAPGRYLRYGFYDEEPSRPFVVWNKDGTIAMDIAHDHEMIWKQIVEKEKKIMKDSTHPAQLVTYGTPEWAINYGIQLPSAFYPQEEKYVSALEPIPEEILEQKFVNEVWGWIASRETAKGVWNQTRQSLRDFGAECRRRCCDLSGLPFMKFRVGVIVALLSFFAICAGTLWYFRRQRKLAEKAFRNEGLRDFQLQYEKDGEPVPIADLANSNLKIAGTDRVIHVSRGGDAAFMKAIELAGGLLKGDYHGSLIRSTDGRRYTSTPIVLKIQEDIKAAHDSRNEANFNVQTEAYNKLLEQNKKLKELVARWKPNTKTKRVARKLGTRKYSPREVPSIEEPTQSEPVMESECIHVKDCPKFGLAVDAKGICNTVCGGHHCVHFTECKPLVTEAANAQFMTPLQQEEEKSVREVMEDFYEEALEIINSPLYKLPEWAFGAPKKELIFENQAIAEWQDEAWVATDTLSKFVVRVYGDNDPIGNAGRIDYTIVMPHHYLDILDKKGVSRISFGGADHKAFSCTMLYNRAEWEPIEGMHDYCGHPIPKDAGNWPAYKHVSCLTDGVYPCKIVSVHPTQLGAALDSKEVTVSSTFGGAPIGSYNTDHFQGMCGSAVFTDFENAFKVSGFHIQGAPGTKACRAAMLTRQALEHIQRIGDRSPLRAHVQRMLGHSN
jgi:hypothetical protein